MMCVCLIRQSEKWEAHIRACIIIRQIISLLKNLPKEDYTTLKKVCVIGGLCGCGTAKDMRIIKCEASRDLSPSGAGRTTPLLHYIAVKTEFFG